ncbi:hypothetical protein F511_00063 [Dorcoceras hygrometricum]|nr:hypothetical protein F511_00063 [Dorcoceras hygrometricum]
MDSLKPNLTNFNDKKPGNFKANAPCKNHPKHRQSPGVCSICLRERLSQLPKIVKSSKVGVSSSTSSSCSDLSSSSCSSPVVNYTCRVEYLEAGKSILQKSRSMACVLHIRGKELDDNNGKKSDVKRGFWSKLLPRRGKALRHSTTVRERVIPEVH